MQIRCYKLQNIEENKMKKYYISKESNSVCVWNGETGECVFQISRYADGYTGYEQAKKKCEELNKG